MLDLNFITPENHIPMWLTHGTCDDLVPYATAIHHYFKCTDPGYMMMFGSASMHKRILELNGSSYFITYCGEKHGGYTNYPGKTERDQMLWFIDKVLKGEHIQIHRIIQTGKSCAMDDELGICE